MTPEQNTQFVAMQTDVQVIKTQLSEQSIKIEKMLIALLGSDLTQDGGLVRRINELEQEKDRLCEELEDIKARSSKLEFHQKIMWGVGGFSLAAIVSQLISIIFKAFH